jgi:exosortase/archaeosortase family protein
VKKFLFLYFLALVLLFALFYWEASPLANFINQWQVNLSSLLTSFTLDESLMQNNHIFISSHLTLVIDKECNGFIPYFFFLASIIAFPSSITHKIKWAILGYLLLTIFNVFRIWFITQFVMNSENNFSLAHDYLGNIFLVFLALLLFITFIKTR